MSMIAASPVHDASMQTAAQPVADVVREIWHRALGPKARHPDAHILRIGIGLRRVTRLLQEIEQALGIRVPPTALLRLGTVAALIEAIARRDWPPSSPCILLKDGNDQPPLYVFSAGSGLVLELCDLVRLIDYPGQIWGMQLPGLDGEAPAMAEMTQIGRFYQAAITARQPTGPYHLVGYSFGGSAAIETARCLAAAGGTIGLLGLIDSNVDEKYWPKRAWLAGILKRCVVRAMAARHLPPKEAVKHIAVRAANLFHYAARKAGGETAASIHAYAYYIGGLEPDFQAVRDSAIVAYQGYNPRKTDLRLTLFKSELGDPHACDPVPVWQRVTRPGRLNVVMIPGSHTTMIRPPHAHRLAEEIVQRLGTA